MSSKHEDALHPNLMMGWNDKCKRDKENPATPIFESSTSESEVLKISCYNAVENILKVDMATYQESRPKTKRVRQNEQGIMIEEVLILTKLPCKPYHMYQLLMMKRILTRRSSNFLRPTC